MCGICMDICGRFGVLMQAVLWHLSLPVCKRQFSHLLELTISHGSLRGQLFTSLQKCIAIEGGRAVPQEEVGERGRIAGEPRS